MPQNDSKPKAYYVGLYKELVLPLIEKEKAARRVTLDTVSLHDLINEDTEELPLVSFIFFA